MHSERCKASSSDRARGITIGKQERHDTPTPLLAGASSQVVAYQTLIFIAFHKHASPATTSRACSLKLPPATPLFRRTLHLAQQDGCCDGTTGGTGLGAVGAGATTGGGAGVSGVDGAAAGAKGARRRNVF